MKTYFMFKLKYLLDIPDDIHKKLKIKSSTTRKTMKEIILKLIQKYLSKRNS